MGITQPTREQNGREHTRPGIRGIETEERAKQHSVHLQGMANNNPDAAISKHQNEEFQWKELQTNALEDETELKIYCSEMFDTVYDILQSVIGILTDISTDIINHDIPRTVVGRARWDIADGANTHSHVETQDSVDSLFDLR